MSVWEVTKLAVAADTRDEFQSVFRANMSLLRDADGCLDVKVLAAIDEDGVILVCVLWQSVEHHTEVFTKTEAFTKFVGALSPFFTAPPEALHAAVVIDGF